MAGKFLIAATILVFAWIGATIAGQVGRTEPITCWETDGKGMKPKESECKKGWICFATSDGARGCQAPGNWKVMPYQTAMCHERNGMKEFLCIADHCNNEDCPELKECMAS